MPALSRANYRRELAASCLFPVALAAVEGSVAAVIVKNAFAGVVSDARLAVTVGVIGSAGELANITSFAWAALAHGRRKVRFIATLQGIVVAMVAVVAVAPRTAVGLWMLAAAVLVARVCMAGVFTLRPTVWRANYERKARTRATGKFSTIQVMVVACVALLIAAGCDASQGWFRAMLLGACVAGAAGVAAYSRIRVRGHGRLVRAEREGLEDRPSFNPASLWRVLKGDRHYAAFMGAMFIIGTGNIMLTAPLTLTLAEQFHLGAMASMVVTSTLPLLVIPFAIPFWTRLLSRRHVVRFRVLHSWVFVASQSVVLLAAVLNRLELMYIAAMFQGVAFAGGSLAWNLGHLDFAPAHRASHYMGVHVTLNGVRGLLAPIVAVTIYESLRAWRPGAEHWVFAFSVVLCAAGAMGFAWVARSMGEKVSGANRG